MTCCGSCCPITGCCSVTVERVGGITAGMSRIGGITTEASREGGMSLRTQLVCLTNLGAWEFFEVREGEVLLIDGQKVMVRKKR